MLRTAQILVFFLTSTTVLSGQQAAKWTEVYDDKLGFALTLPSDFLIDNNEQRDYFLAPVLASLPEVKDVFERPVLYGRHASVSMRVSVRSIRQTSQAKDYLWRYVPFSGDGYPFQDFKVGKYTGRKVTLDRDELLGTLVAMAVGAKIVTVTAYAAETDRAIYERFIRSLTLDGQKLFGVDSDEIVYAQTRVALSDLQTSPEITVALAVRRSRIRFSGARPLSDFVSEPKPSSTMTRHLIILRQPRKFPYLPPHQKFNGTIKAKVVFQKDNTIGDIVIYGDAPKQMLKKIFAEIQEIKFLPAQIDGRNIDLKKDLRFDLRIN